MKTESAQPAITVDKISKTFRLPRAKNTSVKSAFINIFSRRRGYELQKALENISFEIKRGEFFGVVGRNGSGKSTLLKLLAGIYTPTKGQITLHGKLTPFIELGVGFNPELTGRENVFLNGALLGFSRKEMAAMYDDIVEFAELERFMGQKLKNYSSGMQVRLAFSIAIRANTEILLIDEVLAVGDANFQRKCYDYFSEVKQQGKTIIFVSHDMEAVRNFCSRAALIDQGKLIKVGSSYEVTEKYTQLNLENLSVKDSGKTKKGRPEQTGDGQAIITKVWTGLEGRTSETFAPHQKVDFNIQFEAIEDLDDPIIGLSVQDSQDRVVFATNTKEEKTSLGIVKAGEKRTVTFTVENLFTNDSYYVSCAVANSTRLKLFSRAERAHKFLISGWRMPHSLTHLPCDVTIK